MPRTQPEPPTGVMEARKQMCSLARLGLPGLGFGLTCIGAYLTSLEEWNSHILNVILAYILIACGFLTFLTGVFWAICHSIRNKRLQPNRRPPSAHFHVYTVDRYVEVSLDWSNSQLERQFHLQYGLKWREKGKNSELFI